MEKINNVFIDVKRIGDIIFIAKLPKSSAVLQSFIKMSLSTKC